MKKVLLIGKKGRILQALKDNLSPSYAMSLCDSYYEEVLRAIHDTQPDVLLMYQNQPGDLEPYMFRTVQNDYPQLPVLIVCTLKDAAAFQSESLKSQFSFLLRPVGAPAIIKKLAALLSIETPVAEAASTASTPEAIEEEDTTTDYTILAVDDNPAVLRNIKSILGSDYKVLLATSGDKALEILLKTPNVDLILLDYEMPGKSGADMIRAFHGLPQTKNIPVVFLTGVQDRERIAQVIQHKPAGYLLKPVVPELLLKSITEVLWKTNQ